MQRKTRAAFCLLALLALVPGCQKLDHQSTVRLNPGEVKPLEVDAPARDQKVVVDFTADNNVPVSIFVVEEDNRDKVENDLSSGQQPAADLILGNKEKTASGTIEFTAPAKKKFYVIVTGMKPATVKVKIKGM